MSDTTDGRTLHKSERLIHHSFLSGFILKSQSSRIEQLEIAIESLKSIRNHLILLLEKKTHKHSLVILNAECTCGSAPAITAPPISKMPYSCGDLQQMGHASSGLYSVLGAKQIETVYCDFTKPINADGIMRK